MLTSSIEAFSKEEQSTELWSQLKAENVRLWNSNSTIVKLCLHGPIYYNRNEYYALPSAFAADNEEPLCLLHDAYLAVGSGEAFRPADIQKVQVQVKTAAPKATTSLVGGGANGSGTVRCGFIQGKPVRTCEGYSVLFVEEDGQILRERVMPADLELLEIDWEQDGWAIDVINEKVVRLRNENI